MSSLITFLLAAAAIALAASLLMEPLGERLSVSRRLKGVAGLRAPGRPLYETRPSGISTAVKMVIVGCISTASRFSSAAARETIRKKLILAGNPKGITEGQFIGIRWVATLLGAAVPAVLLTSPKASGGTKLLLVVTLAALVWVAFDFFLMRLITQRQKAIFLGLPDALDVLTVCVDAGLGFDAALSRVVDKFKGPLIDEFTRLMQDIRMGRSRRESLKEFGTRSGVDDLNTFATAIIQADQLGVSICNILRTQSDKLRTKRKQRAEETAMKAPVKMLIPMVLLIFPSIFVVLLGPGVIQIITTLSVK